MRMYQVKDYKMSQRFASFMVLLGCLGTMNSADAAVTSNRRAMTKWEAFKASAARNTEIDACSSRNIAENVRSFYKCLQSKMSKYTTTTSSGAAQWKKSSVFAVKQGSVQTGRVTISLYNRTLFSQWKNYYTQFLKIQGERQAQIQLAIDGSLDTDEDDAGELNKTLQNWKKQKDILNQKLESLQAQWETFVARVEKQTGKSTGLPKDSYPTRPDPSAPFFQKQVQRSNVWMIDESFYSAVRKVLDQNPNAHLQLMKYYLIEMPALFRTMTIRQASLAQANKMFQISLRCADPKSIEGALLSIAASAGPPLPYLPLSACQFDGQRVGKTDGSQITSTNGTGV